MSIGMNIKNLRKEKNMTLQQIADIMGCSPQLISQYESGKRIPKLPTIRKIAAALGVYISDLVDDWSKFSQEEINEDWENGSTGSIPHKKAIELGGYQVNDSEKPLLDNYRQLNQAGQDKAIEHVELLTKIPEYRKE